MVKTYGQYVDKAVLSSEGRERQILLGESSKYYSTTSGEVRTRHPSKYLQATAPRLAKIVLAERYNDLFEELMTYMEDKWVTSKGQRGIASRDELTTPEDYEVAVKDYMGERVEKRTLTPRNVDNLLAEVLETPNAKKFFRERNVVKVTTRNWGSAEGFVPEKKRATFRERVRNGEEVYRLVNPENRTVTIVHKTFVNYKGTTRETWRDFRGGFGLKPSKLRARYS